MNNSIDNIVFKKIIILFWALWWAIAFWTDLVGGLVHIGILHASWAPDTNYPFLVESLKMYPLPTWIPPFLFLIIILWSLLSAALFMWASIGLRQASSIWKARAQRAFIISLTYWLAFFVADQLVMKFDVEQNHMVQGGFQLLTFLALYLLPNNQIDNE